MGPITPRSVDSLLARLHSTRVAEPADRSGLAPGLRYFFPIGFVGGYTTFSTYAFEIQSLIARGATGTAAAYFLASNAAGLAAVWLGLGLGRKL